MDFKQFLFMERHDAFLSEKLSYILTALQELEQNSSHIGSRYIVAAAERIADNIRQVLHSNWSKSEEKHLITLQAVGVALAKSIDENDDLINVVSAAKTTLEQLIGKLKQPVNSL